jgi:hypothetical protein
VKTLKNLKKRNPNLIRKAGNWRTLAKLMRDGDIEGQKAFLRSLGVSEAPTPNEVNQAYRRAKPLAYSPNLAPNQAPKKTRKLTRTRNEYWAAYKKAGENLATQGLRTKAENKRQLLESRRLGLNNAEIFRTMGKVAGTAATNAANPAATATNAANPAATATNAANPAATTAAAATAAPAPAPAAAATKRSPVKGPNINAATGYLLSLGPQGAKGPSAVQSRQYARMVKNGRQDSIEQFIRNYVDERSNELLDAVSSKKCPKGKAKVRLEVLKYVLEAGEEDSLK